MNVTERTPHERAFGETVVCPPFAQWVIVTGMINNRKGIHKPDVDWEACCGQEPRKTKREIAADVPNTARPCRNCFNETERERLERIIEHATQARTELPVEADDGSKYLADDRIDKTTLYELYWGKQYSTREVAVELDESRDTVATELGRHGIPTRTSGSPQWDGDGIPPAFQLPSDHDDGAAMSKSSPDWSRVATDD
jgi:hypothetical protein